MFIAPPSGEPTPPIPAPHPIAIRISVACLQFLMSVYPASSSIVTAIGQYKAQTATLGIKEDKSTEAINHAVIWEVIDGPIRYSAFRAIRLSRPVVLQPSDNSPAPKIRIRLDEDYCEIIEFMGII